MTKKAKPKGRVLYYKRLYQDLNNNYVWKTARVVRTITKNKVKILVMDNGDELLGGAIKRAGGIDMFKPAPGFSTSYYSKIFKV